MFRIGLTNRPISTIALPYSSYASASTFECRAISRRVLRVIVDAPQIVAVRHRRERPVERQDLEAVRRQVELADDLGPQQRDDVRADRVLEARVDLFGHRRAAEHVAALEHQHLPPGAREVCRADQPVVAAANHDDVVVACTIAGREREKSLRWPCARHAVLRECRRCPSGAKEASQTGKQAIYNRRSAVRSLADRGSGSADAGVFETDAGCAIRVRLIVVSDQGLSHAHRNPRPRPHARVVREPQLPRVVRLLRRQRVRRASRARIQRHPERVGAHRRLAALQVHGSTAATLRGLSIGSSPAT